MSNYYKYSFVSPTPTYARIKEEFKSYFDSGIVDDTLFPLWTLDCLDKLGRGSYPIYPAVLNLENYEARLPDDFKYMREAWMCSTNEQSFRMPSFIYQGVSDSTRMLVTSRLDSPQIYCDICTEEECGFPDMIKAIYKTTEEVAFTFRKSYLLTPGNINTACPTDLYCANKGAAAPNSYDIHDNKLVCTQRDGIVYILYYSDGTGDEQLIPNDEAGRFRKYIELYIKSKLSEQVFNQTTDETYNQSFQKMQYYKQQADEAYILADIESKKETVYKKVRAITRTRRRNWKYEI